MLKIPISPITCESEEWNKEENWESFETALDGLERSGCDGLSFVLTKNDPFVCIDLDKVKDRFEDVCQRLLIVKKLYCSFYGE